MLTFYDIPSKVPGQAWSPTNWKVRFVLNYKQLPYKTEWVEYPNIESLCKERGIPPTAVKPDGSPYYTLPAIYDDETGSYVSDTIPIAQYLDKTYPESPAVIPTGTVSLMHAFIDSSFAKFMPLWSFLYHKMALITNPISSEYLERTRGGYFGKPLKEIVPTGEARAKAMEEMKKGFGEINAWYEKGGKKFIMGDKPTLPDFVLAATFVGAKVLFGEGSEEWKETSEWQEGRWVQLLDDLKEYQAVL